MHVLVTCRYGSCYAGNKHALMDRAADKVCVLVYRAVLIRCVSLCIVLC